MRQEESIRRGEIKKGIFRRLERKSGSGKGIEENKDSYSWAW